MGESRITPEKELLNLIEGSKDDSGSRIHTEAVKRKVAGFFSPGALAGRLSFFKDALKQGFKGGKFYFDIKALNKFLVLCIFFLAVYFAVNFVISMSSSKKMVKIEFDPSKAQDSLALTASSTSKAVSYYLEKARSKNIFSMTGKIEQKEVEVKAERDKVLELAKDLKLVGISWSDDPDVIIEDKKSQQTFFLKKGQSINGFALKVVFKDKVILSYGAEEIELR